MQGVLILTDKDCQFFYRMSGFSPGNPAYSPEKTGRQDIYTRYELSTINDTFVCICNNTNVKLNNSHDSCSLVGLLTLCMYII